MSIKFKYNYPQVARDSGFKMRKYNDGPMDWQVLGSVEIERLVREQDFHKIDSTLEHLCEAPLGSILESNILDQSIVKYFLCSQFAIQYLMFCRTFLDETVQELREAHNDAQLEIAKLRKSLSESTNEVLQLNKKITEIETIREVVYPCHLCTKNFVSNESLNIHIGRKHGSNSGRANNGDKNTDSPGGHSRERENDLTLINTIKLELEIKQLKERLNIAEKDIRERALHHSRRPTPREIEKKIITREIGIQNNLEEEKEQDDVADAENALPSARTATLKILTDKIYDFELWRDKLRKDYERFMVEIDKKFELLTITLEQTNTNAKEMEQCMQTNIERSVSPSVEDLERLLIEKVAEIGKASAKKLEEVVQHMESNYERKLKELELEIKKRNTLAATPRKEVKEMVSKDVNVKNKISSATFIIDPSDMTVASGTASVPNNNDQQQPQDLVEVKKAEGPPQVHTELVESAVEGGAEDLLTVSFESNKTFEVKEHTNATNQTTNLNASIENTDVSDSLPSDAHSEIAGKNEYQQPNKYDRVHSSTELSGGETAKVDSTAKEKPSKKPKTTKRLKPFTRRDAKRLANKELAKHGITNKTKTISTTMLKRVSAQLADRRQLLKEKYPLIYATRNRIKKLVDKLCSSKLPADAEQMLKTMPTYQPIEMPTKPARSRRSVSVNNSLENLSPTNENTSTPRSLNIEKKDRQAIKQRLEKVLSIPFDERPSTSAAAAARSIRSPHRPMASMKPITIPRKRVMFNTPKPHSDAGNDSSDSAD